MNIRKVFMKMETGDKDFVAMYIGAQREYLSRDPFCNGLLVSSETEMEGLFDK